MKSPQYSGVLGIGSEVILFGVEVDFAADVVDSVHRNGARIRAAVLLGLPEWALSNPAPIETNELSEELLRTNFFAPRNNPGLRKKRLATALELGFRSLVSVIDPTSTISPAAELGAGVFITLVRSLAPKGSSVIMSLSTGLLASGTTAA